MRLPKPCLDCGTPSPGNYCPDCTKRRQTARDNNPQRKAKKTFLYGPNYRRLRATVIANATTCHICEKGFDPHDPWEADHLYPELGDASPLAPAHRSCNQQRGNKQINQ